jgi:hypothetical protein
LKPLQNNKHAKSKPENRAAAVEQNREVERAPQNKNQQQEQKQRAKDLTRKEKNESDSGILR